ncbi:unnamed protein product [Arabidopsis halleri]
MKITQDKDIHVVTSFGDTVAKVETVNFVFCDESFERHNMSISLDMKFSYRLAKALCGRCVLVNDLVKSQATYPSLQRRQRFTYSTYENTTNPAIQGVTYIRYSPRERIKSKPPGCGQCEIFFQSGEKDLNKEIYAYPSQVALVGFNNLSMAGTDREFSITSSDLESDQGVDLETKIKSLHESWIKVNQANLELIKEKRLIKSKMEHMEIQLISEKEKSKKLQSKLAATSKCSCALENEDHNVALITQLKADLVAEKETSKRLEQELMEYKKNVRMLNSGTKNLYQILSMGRTENTRFGLGYQGDTYGSETSNIQDQGGTSCVTGRDTLKSGLSYNRSSLNLRTYSQDLGIKPVDLYDDLFCKFPSRASKKIKRFSTTNQICIYALWLDMNVHRIGVLPDALNSRCHQDYGSFLRARLFVNKGKYMFSIGWDLFLNGVSSYVGHSRGIFEGQLTKARSSTCVVDISHHLVSQFGYRMVISYLEVSLVLWPPWVGKAVWSPPNMFTMVTWLLFLAIPFHIGLQCRASLERLRVCCRHVGFSCCITTIPSWEEFMFGISMLMVLPYRQPSCHFMSTSGFVTEDWSSGVVKAY